MLTFKKVDLFNAHLYIEFFSDKISEEILALLFFLSIFLSKIIKLLGLHFWTLDESFFWT